MRKFRQSVSVAVLAAFFLSTTACQERVVYTPPAMSGGGGQVQGQNGLNQEQFDLQTAIGLLRTNKVRDAQSLEAAINDSSSGINNVDLDNDGQIDYIGIQESVSGNERHMAFMACPSSKVGEPTKIADVTIRDDGQQVYVGGGYSSVFHGYNNAYYSYFVPRASFGDALFLAWMLTPSRPYYAYHPYGYGWAPRRVYAPHVMTQTRTSYQTQTRVSPIQRVTPPANYAKAAAVKMPSSFASKPTGSGLNGTAGQMRDFKVDNKPKQAGTAFGAPTAKPSVPASSSWGSSSAAKPSSSWGSAPAAKPSSSWGSAPAARPSSSWGSSSSAAKSSSSWGGGSSSRSSSGGSSFGGGRRK